MCHPNTSIFYIYCVWFSANIFSVIFKIYMDLVLKKTTIFSTNSWLNKSILHNQSTILASLIKLMWMGYQYFIMIVPIPFENVALFPVERKSKKKRKQRRRNFFYSGKTFFPVCDCLQFFKVQLWQKIQNQYYGRNNQVKWQKYLLYSRHHNLRFVYFLPTFWGPFFCFQGGFFRQLCPYVWLVFKSGF